MFQIPDIRSDVDYFALICFDVPVTYHPYLLDMISSRDKNLSFPIKNLSFPIKNDPDFLYPLDCENPNPR